MRASEADGTRASRRERARAAVISSAKVAANSCSAAPTALACIGNTPKRSP